MRKKPKSSCKERRDLTPTPSPHANPFSHILEITAGEM